MPPTEASQPNSCNPINPPASETPQISALPPRPDDPSGTSQANEAAATDPVARLKKGHPGLRRHSERSRGALFDLLELCVG